MKYYAKQVAPEFVEDDLFYQTRGEDGKTKLHIEDEAWEDNIIIDGNKDFISYFPKKLEDLKKNIEYFDSDLQGWYGEKESLTTLANCYFKKHNGKKWSKKELHQWKMVSELIGNYSRENEEKAMITALKLITNKTWRKICIKGCCQSDWQYGYASEDISKKELAYIEMCYFNTGEEYIIYGSKKDMNDDIIMCSLYVDGWKAKENLCEILNCGINDLTVYIFDGYTKTAKYKIA